MTNYSKPKICFSRLSPFGGGWGRFYTISLFFILISCDPCPDCGEPVLFEPITKMIFINQSQIPFLDDSLDYYAFNDSALSSNSFILDTLRDRIEDIEVGLDTADNPELEQEKMEIEQLIPGYKDDSSFYAKLNVDADSITDILTSTKSDINSGLLRIETLEIVETGQTISYSDSATTWNFPLLYDGNASTYDFTIAEEPFSISLEYETFTEVDAARNVIVRAKDILVVESSDNFITLDSCDLNCVDGKATFTFYF